MKSLEAWLGEYGESHRNPVNKTIHWVCVPVIAFAVIGLLRAVPLGGDVVNVASVALTLSVLYYLVLSPRLALGIAVVFAAMYAVVQASYAHLGVTGHIVTMVGLFVVAWIGQFIGHHVEGAKPSFFKDLQFLLIGPLWLLAALYRRFNLLQPERLAGARY